MDERNDYNSIPITAVEWLIQQIDDQDNGDIPMWIYDYGEKVKQMEKEQIINAMEYNNHKHWFKRTLMIIYQRLTNS